MDLTATDAAELTGLLVLLVLSVPSTNDIYLKIPRRIAEHRQAQSPFDSEVEIDESYFGPKRIYGKRGRGAGHKTIVLRIFKLGDCVYTQIVPDVKKTTLCKAIRSKVGLDTIVYSDAFRRLAGLRRIG